MKRYHVTTFGCQMNAHDSERIKGMLEELGLGEAQSQDEADVIVFNTCTIREKPDTKLAAYLGDAAARKREDPDRVIAVGGCYAEAQRERIFELYPDVDVAFGPGTIPHLAEWLGAGGEAPRGRFGTGDERSFAGTLPIHQERRLHGGVRRGDRSARHEDDPPNCSSITAAFAASPSGPTGRRMSSAHAGVTSCTAATSANTARARTPTRCGRRRTSGASVPTGWHGSRPLGRS